MSAKHFDQVFPKLIRNNKLVSSEIDRPPPIEVLDIDGKPTLYIDASVALPKLAEQVAGYFEILDDLNRGVSSLKRMFFLEAQDGTISEALFTHAIMSYGRCFTKADRRKVWLSAENAWIKKMTDEESTHEQIMHLRHQFFAHAGVTCFQDTKVLLLVDDPENPQKINGINCQSRSLYRTDPATTLRIAAHLETVASRVKIKLDKVNEKLSIEARKELGIVT